MSATAVPQVSRDELIERLHDPALTIVNVLPREAWTQQRIPGSLSLPLAEIQDRAAEVLPDRSAEIVVYCASHTCDASPKALRLLNGLGYTRVRDFDGGIAEWVESGLPVEKGDGPLFHAKLPGYRFHVKKRTVPLTETKNGFRPLDWFAARSITGLLGTWILINLLCGIVYWLISFLPGHGLREQGQALGHGAAQILDAIYFSFVTGLSIGFGDIVPVGLVRVLAVLQGGACLLVFGAIISKLVSGRQEELTEAIHRVTFEDRLGRVRTNLHLVVSEIQDVAAMCADGRGAPRTATRVESAAAVFQGELRAVHDLLYRPHEAPDEDVLEGILAHLEGGLREFRVLLDCMSDHQRNGPALAASVRVIAGLADEICGECVPRAYAPHLKVWMDRIQAEARELTRAR